MAIYPSSSNSSSSSHLIHLQSQSVLQDPEHVLLGRYERWSRFDCSELPIVGSHKFSGAAGIAGIGMKSPIRSASDQIATESKFRQRHLRAPGNSVR